MLPIVAVLASFSQGALGEGVDHRLFALADSVKIVKERTDKGSSIKVIDKRYLYRNFVTLENYYPIVESSYELDKAKGTKISSFPEKCARKLIVFGGDFAAGEGLNEPESLAGNLSRGSSCAVNRACSLFDKASLDQCVKMVESSANEFALEEKVYVLHLPFSYLRSRNCKDKNVSGTLIYTCPVNFTPSIKDREQELSFQLDLIKKIAAPSKSRLLILVASTLSKEEHARLQIEAGKFEKVDVLRTEILSSAPRTSKAKFLGYDSGDARNAGAVITKSLGWP